MNSIRLLLAATAIIASSAFHPQVSAAAGFTGKEFASWSIDGQNGYIQASVTMAGVVLTRLKPSASNCIDTWYFGASKAERDRYIRETIASFDEHHPAGVILAIIEQECGKLKQ